MKKAAEEIKIKCEYCSLATICSTRKRKEAFENAGWLTRCTKTPNRPGKKKAQ